jgi:hypothetical protein
MKSFLQWKYLIFKKSILRQSNTGPEVNHSFWGTQRRDKVMSFYRAYLEVRVLLNNGDIQ